MGKKVFHNFFFNNYYLICLLHFYGFGYQSGGGGTGVGGVTSLPIPWFCSSPVQHFL